MSAWQLALLFWCGMIAVIFAAIWADGPSKHNKLLTGRDCVEVSDRLWAKRKQLHLTLAEEIDLETCTR